MQTPQQGLQGAIHVRTAQAEARGNSIRPGTEGDWGTWLAIQRLVRCLQCTDRASVLCRSRPSLCQREWLLC